MTIEILELKIQDYEDAIALWNCEGVSILCGHDGRRGYINPASG